MKRAEPEVRHYPSADHEVRQHLRAMYKHYLADRARFAAFDPAFDAAFTTAWAAALDAVDAAVPEALPALPPDPQREQALMQQARAEIQALFYYVEQTFPEQPDYLDHYGQHLYLTTHSRQSRLRTLLPLVIAAATRDLAALTAHGYRPERLQALQRLAAEFYPAKPTQDPYAAGTDGYVRLHNQAYDYGQRVSQAATQLFLHEADRRRCYDLPTTPPADALSSQNEPASVAP